MLYVINSSNHCVLQQQQQEEAAEEQRRLLLHSSLPPAQQPAVPVASVLLQQQQNSKREQQQQIHLQKNSANQINLTPAASSQLKHPGIPKSHHQEEKAVIPAKQPVNKPAVAVPTASMADPAAEAVANIPGMEPTNR